MDTNGSSGSEAPADPGPRWLVALETFTRVVNRIFASIACLLVLVIMVLIVVAVVFRYGLQSPIAWVLDVTIFILAFVFFLAVAPALESGSHIEVDLFDPLIPRPLRKAQRLVGKALTLIFGCVFLWFVVRYYAEIVEVDELSFTMITVPLKYVYWIGPVGAAQFLLTAIVLFLRFLIDPLPDEEAGSAALSHQ
ncbi:MAG: TRAP transporter small permease subunit [Hyphomicrobiales bacterium]|nr:TRAP transporter small permease subunit [Hyphomicrobiales bacterium]